jgi:multidrug efflux pump subunit AcrA (membrane-fusion protein)
MSRALQLKEEIRGLEAQLQVVRQQQAQLLVKSPLAGVVITWDAERQLAGRPVKRGDSLLTVADLAGPWELILDVPDRRAGHVLAARRQRAELPITFQLGTDPGAVRRGTVKSISPATELSSQSEPVVHVTAVLADAPPAQLRPGATVVARIDCGRSSLGYFWLHELWEAVRLRMFL